MASWKDTEASVRKAAASIWGVDFKSTLVHGRQIDAYASLNEKHSVAIEVTEKKDINKIQGDLNKLIHVRNANFSSGFIQTECVCVTAYEPTLAMQSSGKNINIDIISIEKFQARFIPFDAYNETRKSAPFGSAIDPETGNKDSRLMHLQFVESESTFDYFSATRAYLERHGKPVAFYSDKHGVFRVNKKDAVGGDGMTQFGRALHALNIDIICANSSQAKGRVERANATLQDRLVKEMRLCGIDTIAAGNVFLPAFIDDYNARFAKAPFDNRDIHRPLAGHDDLDDSFAWKEERSVSVNLTLQYDQVLFILEPTGIARSLARKRVTVIDYPDGRLAIRHNGIDLPYRTFDKRPQVNQAAIVENKRLGPVLAYIAEKQKELDMSRSAKAPRRRGQKNHMFKVG